MTKLFEKQKESIASFASYWEIGRDGNITNTPDCAELHQITELIGLKSPWKECLGPNDLLRVIYWMLYQASAYLPNDYQGLIKDAPGGKDIITNFQNQLVAYLESLPRTYHAYFPLVGMPAMLVAEHKLTDDATIIDTSFHQDFHPGLLEFHPAQPTGLRIKKPPKLVVDQRYLRVSVNGYADNSPTSSAAMQAMAQLKHFIFLGLSFGLLREASVLTTIRTIDSVTSPPAVIRHESMEEDEAYVLSLPEEFYHYLLRVAVPLRWLRFYDPTGGANLPAGRVRKATTPEEVARTVKERLGELVEFMAVPRTDPDAVRIKAASEWWIDASASQNETISFLQFCIGFEALLGDDDNNSERGITERLADRFAYLLGGTQSERTELKIKFRAVYKKRGNIVHQREPHLTINDSGARYEAKEMLSKAVMSEFKALMKSKKKMFYATLPKASRS